MTFVQTRGREKTRGVNWTRCAFIESCLTKLLIDEKVVHFISLDCFIDFALEPCTAWTVHDASWLNSYFHLQNRNNAQSSCAGLFVAANIGFDFPGAWIHVDMASPVHCVSITKPNLIMTATEQKGNIHYYLTLKFLQGERATGYGVALLCTLFGNQTNSPLLKSVAPSNEPPAKKHCVWTSSYRWTEDERTIYV